jgi:hypothetical protein
MEMARQGHQPFMEMVEAIGDRQLKNGHLPRSPNSTPL